MHEGWKLVCVTPAGRRRYLRLLVPYVLSCPGLDRYDLWVNTPDPADLAFLEALCDVDPRIRLVPLPEGIDPTAEAIRHFWPRAAELDAIYIRFDDDVVWLDPAFFETLLAARLARPADFVVAPLVINNAFGTFLLQTFGKIRLSRPVGPDRFDPTGWRNARLPKALHRLLLELIRREEVGRLACGTVPVCGNSFSINCLSWFGRDIAAFGGVIPEREDEEAAISCTVPLRAGRANAIETRAVAAHFAFYTQRLTMDASGLLDRYLEVARRRPELEPWRSRVEAAFAAVEGRFPVHHSLGGFAPVAARGRKRSLAARLTGRRAPPPAEERGIAIRPGPHF